MVKHIQIIRRQKPTNYLSVFDHFVGLAFKRLKLYFIEWRFQRRNSFLLSSNFLFMLTVTMVSTFILWDSLFFFFNSILFWWSFQFTFSWQCFNSFWVPVVAVILGWTKNVIFFTDSPCHSFGNYPPSCFIRLKLFLNTYLLIPLFLKNSEFI